MTLADQVRHNVLSKTILERGAAFEYYYKQLKIMVESEKLLDTGEIVHYNRTGLNGYSFNNEKSGSRWYAFTLTRFSGNHEIHLKLMR